MIILRLEENNLLLCALCVFSAISARKSFDVRKDNLKSVFFIGECNEKNYSDPFSALLFSSIAD